MVFLVTSFLMDCCSHWKPHFSYTKVASPCSDISPQPDQGIELVQTNSLPRTFMLPVEEAYAEVNHRAQSETDTILRLNCLLFLK